MATNKNSDDEENKDENINSGNESDDTFGLPDIEYEPINREEESKPANEPEPEQSSGYVAPQPAEEQPQSTYQSSYSSQQSEYRYKQSSEEESSSIVPKVLGIILVLIIAGGAAYFFLWYQPAQKEKERLEQERIARDKAKADSLAEIAHQQELAKQAAEQRRLDSLAAIPKEGIIETLSERTGRYYVVVSSAVDDDLIMDYAKKLSNKGVSSKIIPPFGKHKFFRIAVADGESFNEAQQKADAMKPDYSDALWVLKY